MPGPVGNPQCFEGLIEAFFPLVGIHTGQDQGEFDVFGGGQARHKVEKLKDKPDFVTADGRLLRVVQSGRVHVIQPVDTAVWVVKQADERVPDLVADWGISSGGYVVGDRQTYDAVAAKPDAAKAETTGES